MRKKEVSVKAASGKLNFGISSIWIRRMKKREVKPAALERRINWWNKDWNAAWLNKFNLFYFGCIQSAGFQPAFILSTLYKPNSNDAEFEFPA